MPGLRWWPGADRAGAICPGAQIASQFAVVHQPDLACSVGDPERLTRSQPGVSRPVRSAAGSAAGSPVRYGNDDNPRIINDTRRYIRDFDRLDKETTTAEELYWQMLAIHPHRVNPGALWHSAQSANKAASMRIGQRGVPAAAALTTVRPCRRVRRGERLRPA
jgi:hypothetical protein